MVYCTPSSPFVPRTTAPKVVVVDDDWSVVQLVELQLKNAGFEIITCLDPLDALARCEAGDINVFITDFMMPGFTGLELLEVLQQKHPLVARVLLTAAPQEPEVRQALTSGLVEHLISKPWERAELLSAVRAACANRP